MSRRSVAGVVAVGCAASAVAFVRLVRPWYLSWGATAEETAERLPGDELIARPHLVATRAITVRAPVGDVWPWLAQLGQGRGGFYSYDRLENLFGCDIHSADHVVPQWQDIAVGGEVLLAPQVALEIAAITPGRSLVLSGGVPVGDAGPPYDFTWTFALREQSPGTTRLLVRERYAYRERWAPLMVEPVEVVSFVMHQKTLRGIRDRAERRGPPSAPGDVQAPNHQPGGRPVGIEAHLQ